MVINLQTNLRIASQITDWQNERKLFYIMKLTALPCLHPSQIKLAYEEVKKAALKEFPDDFSEYFECYESTWLKLQPEKLSSFNEIIKMNDSEQRYSLTINAKMDNKIPTFYDFIGTLH